MPDKKSKFGETYAEDRETWRAWLKVNHASCNGIWLVYYKKHSGRATVSYDEAVEEALCFGWIDSTVNKYDDVRYKQVFTPRNPRSVWSKLNKSRVEKLIRTKRMTKAGMEKVNAAKKNGIWKMLDDVDNMTIPPELKAAFSKNTKARKAFSDLADSAKKILLYHILRAKLPETRKKRIRNVIGHLTGEKLIF